MIRAKGNLAQRHQWTLGLFIGLSAILMIGKMPWIGTSDFLTRYMSLASVPEAMQGRVSHLLFVPFGALLVVFFRLTLGLRLLGPFRSVLLAVAFQITGIALGLVFLTVVVSVIVVIRPFLKEIRLGYFGRVTVILGVVAGILVATILAASWLQIDSLQRVAYFPVVVLCLTGEGFATKLTREGLPSALWRGAMTALVAVVITLLCGIPGFDRLLLSFPELLILQVISIVLISEFFDLRLLQRLNPPTAATQVEEPSAPGDHHVWTQPPVPEDRPHLMDPEAALIGDAAGPVTSRFPIKVAVVRNQEGNLGVINRLGPRCPEVFGTRTVLKVVEALRAGGHTAAVFEADMTLLTELKEFLSPSPQDDCPAGIVFNIAYGIQGEARYTHVPAMLEMAGVPYTGASPLGHAVSLDKVIAKVLMRDAGVPTPAFRVLRRANDDAGELRFPLIVKPRRESTSYGLQFVRTPSELTSAVAAVVATYGQDALVEEFITGREVAIGLIGNDHVEYLPPVELEFTDGRVQTLTWDDKYHRSPDEPRKICPALFDEAMRSRLEELALATFRACHCRDYARVDIRIDQHGEPYVLEINSMTSLGPGSSFTLASRHAGYSFESLVQRIVEVACDRYPHLLAVDETESDFAAVPLNRSRSLLHEEAPLP